MPFVTSSVLAPVAMPLVTGSFFLLESPSTLVDSEVHRAKRVILVSVRPSPSRTGFTVIIDPRNRRSQ